MLPSLRLSRKFKVRDSPAAMAEAVWHRVSIPGANEGKIKEYSPELGALGETTGSPLDLRPVSPQE
jgi:hypothetical protein